MKIICVGLPKTGTTSITTAIRMLGFTADHSPQKYIGNSENLNKYLLKKVDMISEIFGFPELDFELLKSWFPDAKMIWTKRDYDKWKVSAYKQFGSQRPVNWDTRQVRKHRFGVEYYDEQLFKKFYDDYTERLTEYVKSSDEEILEMDITKGDGFEVLCPFLGVPTLEDDFPHRNKR